MFRLKPFWALKPAGQLSHLDGWINSQFAIKRFAIRALLTLIKPVHIERRAVKLQMNYPADRLETIQPKGPNPLTHERHLTHLEGELRTRCQVAIIGSGAGGGVLACELAERGIDVIIVEAGKAHDTKTFGDLPARHLRELYWQNGTTVALGRPGIPIPLGRTVGGTTTINSGTCFRTPDRILNAWQKAGLLTDKLHLDSAFARVEERLSIQPVAPHLLGGSSSIIAQGAETLGLAHGPLHRNIRECKRSAVCAFGCPSDAKQSTNISYVPWALDAGARLFSDVRVHRIKNALGRATGIIGRHRETGHTLEIDADIVVSACGAIAGVPFLLNNGLKNPHLGRHLSIHPGTKIVADMPEPVRGWEDTPQGYGIYELFDEGIMFEGAFVPPEYASIAFPFAGRKLTELMARYEHLAIFGLLVSDEPNGRVRRGPGGHPLISYWLSRRDAQKMVKGLRMLSQVFFAAGAETIYLPIAGIETQRSLDSALKALSKPISPWRFEAAAFHPLGTARMSVSSRSGVIKPTLETHELDDLFVVDGSIFPSSLGVNPQVSIMAYATMVAEQLSDRLN
ncbi:MAG: GMC family oxidoreductase [Myxococcota bacterium]|nr:GMC family oxidoreductase [Myxococcota bacterium]